MARGPLLPTSPAFCLVSRLVVETLSGNTGGWPVSRSFSPPVLICRPGAHFVAMIRDFRNDFNETYLYESLFAMMAISIVSRQRRFSFERGPLTLQFSTDHIRYASIVRPL